MQDQRVTGFELSPVQERLYAISKGGAAFQCQSALLIEGPLDTARLQAAVEQAVSRYEILRTNFRLLAGRRRLLQVVQPAAQCAVVAVDLRSEAPGGLEVRIERLLREFREEPLDLDNGALARFRLLILDPNRHLLTLTLSSLCADAQTLTVLAEEIVLFYKGDAKNLQDPLQYADFAAWQRDLLESDEPDAQTGRDYWRDQEAGARAVHALPYELRQPGSGFTPEAVPVCFSPELSAHLAARSKAHGAPPADFLLTCWLSLFFRLTHQEEGVVGLSLDGRTYEELGETPGLFSKTNTTQIRHIASLYVLSFVF